MWPIFAVTILQAVDNAIAKLNVKDILEMGEKHPDCDDAERRLWVDWNGDPSNYECSNPGSEYPPTEKGNLPPRYECVENYEKLRTDYNAPHYCMNDTIEYDTKKFGDPPSFGPHRPIWGIYGEYRYLPKERWLHNLEHGAVALLYHPCTEPSLVNQLRDVVTGCLNKYVISPYKQLEADQPLVLLAWGCRLHMSSVDTYQVKRFIQKHFLHAFEDKPDEGKFNKELIKASSELRPSGPINSLFCGANEEGKVGKIKTILLGVFQYWTLTVPVILLALALSVRRYSFRKASSSYRQLNQYEMKD